MSAQHPSPRRRRIEGLAALVLVQIAFGLFTVLVKIVVDPGSGLSGAPSHQVGEEGASGGVGLAPRAIAFWRILLMGGVLSVLAAAAHGRAFLVPGRDLARLALCGLFGVVTNQWLALEGVARSHALTAGVLMTLIPVFTYAVAIGVRQERASRRRGLGIVVALVGALGLVLGQAHLAPSAAASQPIVGSLLIVANCLSYAIYLVLARSLLTRIPPLVVIAWTFLFALLALPFLAREVELWPAAMDPRALRAMALLLLFPTLIGYTVNAWALARVSASTTAVFVYLQPLVAGVTAMAVLGERPGMSTLLSSAVLFLGIGLVVWRRRGVTGGASGGAH